MTGRGGQGAGRRVALGGRQGVRRARASQTRHQRTHCTPAFISQKSKLYFFKNIFHMSNVKGKFYGLRFIIIIGSFTQLFLHIPYEIFLVWAFILTQLGVTSSFDSI